MYFTPLGKDTLPGFKYNILSFFKFKGVWLCPNITISAPTLLALASILSRPYLTSYLSPWHKNINLSS